MRPRTALAAAAGLIVAMGLAAPLRALPGALLLAVAAGDSSQENVLDLGGLVQQQQGAVADSSVAGADTTAGGAPSLPLIWTRSPAAKLKADVRTLLWQGMFENTLMLRDESVLAANGRWSSEDYRQQDKTIETRSGSLRYANAGDSRLELGAELNNEWTEDRTVNLTGSANVNKRDFKQARVTMDSLQASTAGFDHSLRLEGRFADQRGASLGVRNEFREGTVSGRLASRCAVAPGLTLVASLYGEKTKGDRVLGAEAQSSASVGDTLGTWVGWKRGGLTGSFDLRASAFTKDYLDFRRNANGVVDTLGALEKIVQELESQDALKLAWQSAFEAGRLRLRGSAARTARRHNFRASGVGEREAEDNTLDLNTAWNAPSDSLMLGYGYEWRWDDQTYKDATSSRGRQYRKRRRADVGWTHRLFRHTSLRTVWQTSLQQEIAQNQFNENDRDRYESNFSTRLETDWNKRFRTSMIFAYRHIEEISIRRTRSANNNAKDTYEIAPGYYWPVASWLKVQQDYRLSIQYTEYLFAGYPGVSGRDAYNKRGTINTKVSLRPSSRLTLTAGHDWNVRIDATKSGVSADGDALYSGDLDQRISTLNFGLTYVVSKALTLHGATKRAKDEKETFGSRGSFLDRRGRELSVGAVVKQTWQGRLGSGDLSGRLSRNLAQGPNVQPAAADYWDADISFTWRF